MFVSLHNHSMYSLLDAISKPDEIIEKVKQLGQNAFAITDHGVVYGAVEFYKLAKENGLKFIYGAEMYICDDINIRDKNNKYYHLVVLAKNETGRINLNKLISASNLKGKYYKPRIDFNILKQHKEGLIVLSACMAGEIQRAIQDSDIVLAKKIALKYKNEFGNDYYLEIQSHRDPEQQRLNRIVVDIAKELGIPYVVTTDSHYVNKEDQEYHSIFVSIRREREPGETYNDCYWQSEEEIYKINLGTLTEEEIKVAIENTVKIAEQCNVDMPLSPPIIPHVQIPKEFNSEMEYLKYLCKKGCEKRGISKLPNVKEYKERLLYELDAVEKMDFAGYFLLVRSYTNQLKRKGIARGSSGGSLIAYLLGIVDIDPIKYGLYFERFIDTSILQKIEEGTLKPEELKVPDIDVDMSPAEREEVLRFIINTYGQENVVNIGTFQYLRAKNAIKDIGRVLGIPFEITNKITKNLDKETIEEALEMGLLDEYKEQYGELFKYAQKLAGLPKALSVHASGKIITTKPVDHYFPVTTNDDGEVIIQCDMHSAEALGLVKIDLLGLRTLDVIYDVLEMIGKDYSYIDPHKINLEDDNVFKLFRDGRTNGVFQFESNGMKDVLKRMQVSSLDDLGVANALFRPGAKKYIDNYINRKFGVEKFEYLHPDLEPILKNTYGIIVFQEQLIEIGRLAGLRNPDLLRKATAKKIPELMEVIEPELKEGLKKRGWTQEQVDKLWDDIIDFAHYSFNKAHSFAYALTAYITAFLKVYHPKEFMCALLNSYEGKIDKIAESLEELRRMEIQVEKFDYKNCYSLCEIKNGKFYYGVGLIKHCNRDIATELRKLNKHYDSFIDLLVDIVNETLINSKQMKTLIVLNFFSEFGNNKKLLTLWKEFKEGKNKYSKNYAEKTKVKRIEELKKIEKELPNEKIPLYEQIMYEYELLGYPISTYDVPKQYSIVLELDKKYTPKVLLYNLNTGKIATVKVAQKLFNQNKFEVGDVLYITKFIKKPQVKYEDGQYIEIKGEFDWWIEKYEIKSF